MLAAATELYEKTGAQAVVLTLVHGLDEQAALHNFAGQVFTGWEIGGRDEKKGVLILASPEPASCVILVGAGLMNDLPPEYAESVREEILYAISEDRISRGVLEGFEAVLTQIYAARNAEPGEHALTLLEDSENSAITAVILITGVVFILARYISIARKSRKFLNGGPIRKRLSFASKPRRDEPVFHQTASPGQKGPAPPTEPKLDVYPVKREVYIEDTDGK